MLSIEMRIGGGEGTRPSDFGKIAITHLRVSDIQITRSPVSLGLSPGVIVLLPRDSNMEFVAPAERGEVCPGNAVVIEGKTSASLSLRQDEERDNGMVSVLEVNALINDALFLKDLVGCPAFLGAREASKIRRMVGTLDMPGEQDTGTFEATHFLRSAELVAGLISMAPQQDSEEGVEKEILVFRRLCLANLDRNFTTEEMAEGMNMSRSTFNRWIKPRFGVSPANYLKQLRLERGMELLLNTPVSIEGIATRTGFMSRFHFSREFKKLFGISPAHYRTKFSSSQENNHYRKGAGLFAEGKYREALQSFEEALNCRLPASERDRCLAGRGACLSEQGYLKEALDAWEALPVQTFRDYALNSACGYLFSQEEHNRLVGLLERLLAADAGDAQRQVIDLWTDFIIRLSERRFAPDLPRYLALRTTYFPHDYHSAIPTAQVLRDTGLYHETTEQCKDIPSVCIIALRTAGLFDQAIEQYEESISPPQRVRTLLAAGRYNEILEEYPESGEPCIRALIALGRCEDAIRMYPDHSFEAMMVAGRFREALAKSDPSSEAWVYAAHALDKLASPASLRKLTSYSRYVAQLYLDPSRLLRSKDPMDLVCRPLVVFFSALDRLEAGETSEAVSLLTSFPAMQVPGRGFIGTMDDSLRVLSPVIHALLGNPEPMKTDFAFILKHYRYITQQIMWHDVAFLSGEIDAKTFEQQPRQLDVQERLCFIQAVGHDLKGRNGKAKELYRRFRKQALPYPYANYPPVRFAEWRLRALGGQ